MAKAVACFTAADEAVMTSISARLTARAFLIERDMSTDPDCYWICPEHSIHPTWVLLRAEDGRYQLRDGLLGIERQGDSLLEILPADWISSTDMSALGTAFGDLLRDADSASDPSERSRADLTTHH